MQSDSTRETICRLIAGRNHEMQHLDLHAGKTDKFQVCRHATRAQTALLLINFHFMIRKSYF